MSTLLPANASFEHLKKQAKDLLHAHARKDAAACATFRNLHRFKNASDAEILAAEVGLHDAQFALAIEYGFRNWAELKARLEAGKPGNGFVLGDKPEHPELDYLRQQAKSILDAHGRKDAGVCPVLRHLSRFAAVPDADILAGTIDFADTQLALAIEYGFKSWVDVKAHSTEWRNRPVGVAGPFKTVAEIMVLPDGAAQFILRQTENKYVAILLRQDAPPVPEWISVHVSAGRREALLGWNPPESARPTLEESRQGLLDVTNDLHGRFRWLALPGESLPGTLPRVAAMGRNEVLAWGRETFVKAAGPERASQRTTAELVSMFKGFLELWQFPLAIEAVAREFADEPLVRLGFQMVVDDVANDDSGWERAREALRAGKGTSLTRFDQRQAAVLASDCGFTRRAELMERVDEAGGNAGPFRTVEDVLGLADGGLQLVASYLRGSAALTLMELDPARVGGRFASALPEWQRGSLHEWMARSGGAPLEEATRELVRIANGLHAARALVRPGESPTGAIAALTLQSRGELAGWARSEFVRIAGDKPASRRELAELGSLFEGFSAISYFPLAAETVAAEFADEELVRMAATQFVDTRPGGGVRHTLELKAKSLAARNARRLDLIVEANWSLLCAESDEMLVARCEAFL